MTTVSAMANINGVNLKPEFRVNITRYMHVKGGRYAAASTVSDLYKDLSARCYGLFLSAFVQGVHW